MDFLGFDKNLRAKRNSLEEIDDIGIPHPDTAVAGGLSDLVFMLRSMDIDVALPRVGVVLLQSVKPEDPARNQVLSLGKRIAGPERNPCAKHGSERHAIADLFADPETSERRLQAGLF